MQVCLHGITPPEVQNDIDLYDLVNRLYPTVNMQDRKPHKHAKLEEMHDTPMAINSVINGRIKPMDHVDWNFK